MIEIVSSPAMVPTTSGSRARSIASASGCAWPAPVRRTTSCWTRSTRRRNSAARALERGQRRRRTRVSAPGRWYAPSPARLTRPSSLMSREMVACVASKPRWRSRRRSCSWLCSGSRSMSSRMSGLAAGFHGRPRNRLYIDSARFRCTCVYKYSFRCIRSATVAIGSRAAASRAAAPVRVAVAGATGYTGQELLRLLGAPPGRRPSRRRCPRARPSAPRGAAGARAPLGRHHHAARSPTRSARDADLVFLALPDAAAAELAPPLVAARRARHRPRPAPSACATRRPAPAGIRTRTTLPDGVAYGLTEHERARRGRAAARRQPGLLSDGDAARAGAARSTRASSRRAPTSSSTPSPGVSGAGKTPSERTHFSEVHGSLSAYGVFGHRHGAEIEQGARRREVTFTPHLVPLDRGILATIYLRVAPGTTEDAVGDVLERAYARRHVRPARRRGAARDQARRAHELLRHRLAGRSRRAAAVARVGHRQPAEGRVRPGRPEHERHARPRRADGPAVSRSTTSGGRSGRRRARPASSAANCSRIAAGLATVAAAVARARPPTRARSSSCTAAARRSTRRWRPPGIEKRQVDGLRITDERDAGRRRVGAGRRDQHAARRGADRGRRAARSA